MNDTLFLIVYIVFSLMELYAVLYFAKVKNKLYKKVTLTSYLIFSLYLLADMVFHIRVSYYILLLVLLSLFVQTYFGYYKDLFSKSRVFDRYLHAYGTFAYTLLLYSIITKLMKPSVSPVLYSLIFVAALGISVGVIFEIIEFRTDIKLQTKMQKGLKDTDMDLIFDVIGAVAASGTVYFFIL